MGEVRVAVLGGGVAGVVVAGELAQHAGVQVQLYERAPQLGGLQRSVTLDGAAYDIGAFIFGYDHELFRTFPAILSTFVQVRPAYASITPAGRLDRYPATLSGFLRDNGKVRMTAALVSLVGAKVRYWRRDSLPSLARYYLGDVFYEESGFRGYIERLYGLPDHEIDLEFAATRLHFLRHVCSLRQRALRGSRHLLRGDAFASYEQPDVLVRPREGFEVVYAAIADELRARGVQVETRATLRSVRRGDDGKFHVEHGDGTASFDRVISTLPLTATAQLIGQPVTEELDYMKLISLFYRFRGESGHSASVLSNLTLNGRWKRLVSFGTIYGLHEGDDYFVVEVTARDVDADTVARADTDFRAHMASLGLYRGTLVRAGAHVTEHAYPVYRVRDAEHVRLIRQRLEASGVDLLGRQGRFDYVTSLVVAERARRLAQRISAGERA